MMKIDIEGGEYGLITALLAHGHLCRVDTITVEWHEKFCKGQWCEIKDSLLRVLSQLRSVDCNVRILYKDDETYLHDGVALSIR